MNAYELANILSFPMKDWETMGNTIYESAAMLRKQQAEIDALKEIVERFISEWTNDFKNYEYNSNDKEENKLRDDVFAILKKAQEK